RSRLVASAPSNRGWSRLVSDTPSRDLPSLLLLMRETLVTQAGVPDRYCFSPCCTAKIGRYAPVGGIRHGRGSCRAQRAGSPRMSSSPWGDCLTRPVYANASAAAYVCRSSGRGRSERLGDYPCTVRQLWN